MAYQGIQHSGMVLAKGKAAKLYVDVGTAEAQTVTVSKNGGAFAAASSTAAAAGSGPATLYVLTVAAADVDTLGPVAFLLTGATDTQVIDALVVDYDPDVGALTDTELAFRAASP